MVEQVEIGVDAPDDLSGGQVQRVALAMVFLPRPAVLVLDEPTTGLDVTTQGKVLDTLGELCRRFDVAAYERLRRDTKTYFYTQRSGIAIDDRCVASARQPFDGPMTAIARKRPCTAQSPIAP